MTAADPILSRIDGLLARLAAPLPAAERACGWTDASRAAFITYYTGLRRTLTASADVDRAAHASIARDLDYWGIVGGELAAEALVIAAALRARPT